MRAPSSTTAGAVHIPGWTLRPAGAGRRIHPCGQGAVVVRVPSDVELGAPPTTIERRLGIRTGATRTRAAAREISPRAVVLALSPTDRLTMAGAMSRATRFMTLISGL